MGDYAFKGWLGLDETADQGKMVWRDFEPKAWEETDVDIKITHCGICGSDLHTLRSGWFGGYALYNRSPSHFVVKIPDGLPSAAAAPMLCAGVTTYSPLKYYGYGAGKRIGVVGLGGLGHFAILWAKAMGADYVLAISRKASKAADALKLGADAYVSADDDPSWSSENARSLDIVISTVSSSKVLIGNYLSLLRRDGTLVQVGNPDDGVFEVLAPRLITARTQLGGSMIGSPKDIREMFQLAVEKKVCPMIEERPMADANEAIVDMDSGKARYRYVLVNKEHL